MRKEKEVEKREKKFCGGELNINEGGKMINDQVSSRKRGMHGEVMPSTDACSCLLSEICHASDMLSRRPLFKPGVTLDMHPARLA